MSHPSRRWSRPTLIGSIGLIVYTYAGYPALLWGWSKVRPRPTPAGLPSPPPVSLVVAAYNEQEVIEDRIANLRELDHPHDRLELVVVTDGSSDETPERAAHAGARVLHRPARAGKAAALDRAVAETSGEILVFSDANNRYAPHTLRELLAPFGDPSVGVVTGSKIVTDELDRDLDRAEGRYWRYESAIKRWESNLGSVTGVAGEVLAVRRAAYKPMPPGTVNDDFTLAMRAATDGWRIAYAPRAVSYEPASASIDDESVRRSRIVAGRYQALARSLPALARRRPLLTWQVISHKGLRPLVPIAMVAAAVSNLAQLRAGWMTRSVALGQATFYGLAAAGAWIERRGGRSAVTYLPYYLCRVNLAALRGLVQAVSERELTLWERVGRGGEAAPTAR